MTLTDFEEPVAQVQSRTFARAPGAPLDRVLPHYQGYVEESSRVTQRRQAASSSTVLIFPFGPELEVAAAADRGSFRAYESGFVAGVADSFAITRWQGTSAGIQVNLSPLVARMLWGVPMSEMANGVFSLDDVIGRAGREAAERVATAACWEERFDAVDLFLTGRLRAARMPSKGLLWAWQRLVDSGGRAPAGDLARSLGWTHKRLIAEFRDHVGVAPKTVARVIRFGRVERRLQASAAIRWADIALDCGYYDQSHLVRDVVQFTGSTPSDYLRRRMPDSDVTAG